MNIKKSGISGSVDEKKKNMPGFKKSPVLTGRHDCEIVGTIGVKRGIKYKKLERISTKSNLEVYDGVNESRLSLSLKSNRILWKPRRIHGMLIY